MKKKLSFQMQVMMLPIVAGIASVIVSFALQFIRLGVESDVIDIIAMVTLYAGVLMAFIGLALATPLGK